MTLAAVVGMAAVVVMAALTALIYISKKLIPVKVDWWKRWR